MTITIQRKPKGWNLKLGEAVAVNYSTLYKLAKALMLFAKGQGK